MEFTYFETNGNEISTQLIFASRNYRDYIKALQEQSRNSIIRYIKIS